jgi:hypothetical protein
VWRENGLGVACKLGTSSVNFRAGCKCSTLARYTDYGLPRSVVLNEVRNSLAHQLEPVKPTKLIPLFIEAAFNAATKGAKPLGARLRHSGGAPAKYSRIALGQAIAVVVGLLAYQHAKIAA